MKLQATRWVRPALGSLIGAAVGLSSPHSGAAADIEQSIEGRLRSANLNDTRVSVYIHDLDTGEALAQIDPDVRMIPASNMKLVTTAAALHHLGPDFRFRTELRLIDDPEALQALGVDRGPVLLVHGDGDPAFADPVILEQHGMSVDDLLDLWVDAVADTGHRRFGLLVIDDRVFDREFAHPDWPSDQLVYRWCAPVAGLNFYQNVLDVLPQPTRSGQAPVVELYPPEAASFLLTSNRASTGRSESFWISRQGPYELTFHGTVKNRRSVPVQVSVSDPPMFFGKVFTARLESRGVAVDAVVRPTSQGRLLDGRVLHRMQTTLPLVLERTNQDSQNMFSEALFKRMGRTVTGRPGSFENGQAAVRIAMQQLMGPRASVLHVADGSGMSRNNQVTARFLVDLLAAMHRHEDAEIAHAFRDSLARGGVNGTLKRRFRRFTEGDVLAKSGYLSGVSALSGYVTLPGAGDPREGNGDAVRDVAFAMLFNGFEPPLTNASMKRMQEEFVGLIEQAYDDRARLGG
mgnify:CR=1 FL=1